MADRLNLPITAQDRTQGAFRSVQNGLRRTDAAVASLAKRFVLLTTIVGGGLLGRQLVRTNAEFQKLQASLTTFTGSVENGKRAFEILQKFAADTPFSVQEVVGSFNILIARGIKPTVEQLRSFGDIAAGSGKSFSQLAEAVADAAVGEFERLKEFGIKAGKEGDKVNIAFGGVTKQIDNNSASIIAALDAIAKKSFAGGIERQAATLTGAFSNFKDSVDAVFFAIGKAGLNAEINRLTRNMSKGMNGVKGYANTISRVLVKALRGLEFAFITVGRNLEGIGKGLLIVFGAMTIRRIANVVRAVYTFTKAIVTSQIVLKAVSALVSSPKFFALFAAGTAAATVGIVKFKAELLEALGSLEIFKTISEVATDVQERLAKSLGFSTDNLEELAGAAETTGTAFVFAEQNVTKTKEAVDKTFNAGARKATKDYFTGIRDQSQNAADAVSSSFNSLENTLSNFFQSGELSFKSFTDTLKKALADLAAKSVISSGAQFLNNSLGIAGGGGGSIFSSIVGGGLGNIAKSGFGFVKKIFGFNAGGMVPGLGGERSDTVPAMLSPGEFVMNASSVRKYGPSFFASLNNGNPDHSRRRGYASGGSVESLFADDSYQATIDTISHFGGGALADSVNQAAAAQASFGASPGLATNLALDAYSQTRGAADFTGQENALKSLFGFIPGPFGTLFSLMQFARRGSVRAGRQFGGLNAFNEIGGENIVASLGKSITAAGDAASTTANATGGFVGDMGKHFNTLIAGASPFLEPRGAGGPVRAGQPYLVGEHGPEVMVPGAAGSVSANADQSLLVSAVKEVRDEVAVLRRSLSRALAGGALAGARA